MIFLIRMLYKYPYYLLAISISLLYHLYAFIPTCDRHINYTIVCTCMFCTFMLLVALANLK